MIKFTTGDILRTDVEALVNSVNCVGIMGRGVALQFKEAFPDNFRAYAEACSRNELQPGRMFVFATGFLANPKFIINFPTKRHWRGKSRIEDIESGLKSLVEEVKSRNIRSIAIPPLGSGLGGLEWKDVRERIASAFQSLDKIDVTVFEPYASLDAPSSTRKGAPPKMTAGRAALVGLISRYLRGLLDPSVTLLEVHKLMYFMQEAGEPLRLRYAKAPYGPYAENLRHVLRDIDGYFVSGYGDGGDAPERELTVVPGAEKDSEGFLAGHPDTHSRFERVADLVGGFETPFGLELLSTVHWVANRDGTRNKDAVVSAVYSWSDRKRQFSPRQIALALDVLDKKGWLT